MGVPTVERVIGEIRELAGAMPVPDASWHPHAALIRAVRDELLADLTRLEAQAGGEERLSSLLGAEVAPRPGSALAALPVPQGEHPYLGEILPVLEAARLVQAAVAAASVAA